MFVIFFCVQGSSHVLHKNVGPIDESFWQINFICILLCVMLWVWK